MSYEKFTQSSRDFIRFYYVTEDLREEAHKLTSYKARQLKKGGKDDPSIEDIELSSAEQPFFDEHMQEAVYKIGNSFVDIMDGAYNNSIFFDQSIVLATTATVVATGIYVIDYKGYNESVLPIVDEKLRNCLILHVLKEWYLNIDLADAWKVNEAKYLGAIHNLISFSFPLRMIGEDYYNDPFADMITRIYEQPTQVSAVTSGNNSSTGVTITTDPLPNSVIIVFVKGKQIPVGYDTTTSLVYFSITSGATALPLNEIVKDAELFWNGDNVGFELDTSDTVAFIYSININ